MLGQRANIHTPILDLPSLSIYRAYFAARHNKTFQTCLGYCRHVAAPCSF
jgi:hypothetical protein